MKVVKHRSLINFELLQEGDGGDQKQQPKQNQGEEEDEYYENDSFIIDDDGANDRDGDLTGSSARYDLDLHELFHSASILGLKLNRHIPLRRRSPK